ncbi:S-adenosyl-L-methionine-dependent methyltransferase [Ampelomyces quisqualis]|uniref:S-adenosyl-L-methionine-dependent methyltransferase n=1 Tax=Ampelomyces quisqualis TaxID=50730 RepID=A0A6A5Q937_AMPQU|nr:S-adenosyl-L-methionine-dependent methyltransferase [Ampelomyces quisqualis]
MSAGTVPENLKARVKESYDAIADSYASRFTQADDPVRLRYIRHLIEQFKASEQSEVNVLELGCGSGIPATKFMLDNDKPAFSVVGNDISTTQLNLARSNLAGFEDRVTLVETDMLSLDYPNSIFDAVTGFYSIIHLPREEQTQLMRKIFAWLKPGGFFLANFGVDEMTTHEIQNWLAHEKGWMFWSGWGKEGSLKMVEDVGMNLVLTEVREEVGDMTFLWILAQKSS